MLVQSVDGTGKTEPRVNARSRTTVALLLHGALFVTGFVHDSTMVVVLLLRTAKSPFVSMRRRLVHAIGGQGVVPPFVTVSTAIWLSAVPKGFVARTV